MGNLGMTEILLIGAALLLFFGPSSTMIDIPGSAIPAPTQSSADGFTPSTTRSQTNAVAT